MHYDFKATQLFQVFKVYLNTFFKQFREVTLLAQQQWSANSVYSEFFADFLIYFKYLGIQIFFRYRSGYLVLLYHFTIVIKKRESENENGNKCKFPVSIFRPFNIYRRTIVILYQIPYWFDISADFVIPQLGYLFVTLK